MLQSIDTLRKEATKRLDQSKRSQFGQYMTPTSIAEFMASLFTKKILEEIRLLDAGAGIGSLTAAFLEKASKNAKSISVSAYEIDNILIDYLKDNLTSYKKSLAKEGIIFNSVINETDFIKDCAFKFSQGKSESFTHAILNPPYKKLHSDSDHRKYLRLVHFETVNLYSAFVGLAVLMLESNGELVAIIPRSFCNGNYYKPFRYLITDRCAIKRMHLFDSRIHAFKDDEVLQENIIIHLVKGAKQGKVIVSKSTDSTFCDIREVSVDFDKIVKGSDVERFIHVPHDGDNHLEDSPIIKYSLKDIGVEVSTGPVVDFRAKEYLSQEPKKGSVPLLYPGHFNGKELDWPVKGKKPNAILASPETQKMLYPNGFYVVVRRFSSKEEKQRIVARVINPNKFDTEFIGIENHLNVFHKSKNGIDEQLALGIATYLNSSYVDTHFRTFNGHTQVNATDLRQMKYPDRDSLIQLGSWAKSIKEFDQSEIDHQIAKIL
jgi:adenine-specific DNA-methyltransferase